MTDAPAVDRADAEQTSLGSVGATAYGKRRRRWGRPLVAIVAFLLALCVLLLAWGLTQPRLTPDDPAATNSEGAAAVAQLLRNHGVQLRVERATSPAGVAGKTLIVTDGDRLTSAQWDTVARQRPARLVFLGPLPEWVDASAQPVASTPVVAEPGCTDPYAQHAGPVRVRKQIGVLATTSGVQRCYPAAAAVGYFVVQRDGIPTYALAGLAENQDLAAEGNAALALGVMGSTQEAVWFVAEPRAARGSDEENQPSFLPAWAAWAGLTALGAAVIVAVWRGRRFGPILSERLPVVVRASETVEGHGRLYQRLGARDTAAAALRRGAIGRLERRYGTADPARLAELVNAATGLPTGAVAQALAGPAPATDRDLIVLKQTLDDIERKARS